MITQEPIIYSTKAPNGLQHTVDIYLLSFPCIICIDNTVEVGGLYDLLDFPSTGEIFFTKVKFLDAYVTGYRITIVVLDTKTGDIMKRSHRLNNDKLPCNWVLTDLFTKTESEKDVINDFCDRK